jgi:thymidylate synthase
MTYEQVLKYVLENGTASEDRTGTGTISSFRPPSIRYDLKEGFTLGNRFPLITTKKVHFKSVVHELLWFLSGDTNIKYLKKHGVTIWDEWADKNGDLGPIYGAQFYRGNQLLNTIENLKKDPYSRRHVITLWNPEDLDKQALHCCHGTVIQFYVRNGELSCSMYQRSADMFLGVPFNIASYALFTHMVAQIAGLTPKELIIDLGDAHIYNNHIEQVKLQLSRQPMIFPELELNPNVTDITKFTFDDVKLNGYVSHPAIKGKVAV